MTETSPYGGRDVGGGIAITDGVRIVIPVGGGAVTILAHVVPLAVAAGDVVL